ncbi:hypothetical protein OTK49_00620 [Vibrio coralliirubri]|uniref:hypothetical protein n=1 Tax=Vibrio coralliirubri TaxID=1516159 RepID=UPI0022847560|nr:hypothetical protein [Vibrio coralliirubri]MCY9861045.1 hypothetical protein [Vibrio coralliirubri]
MQEINFDNIFIKGADTTKLPYYVTILLEAMATNLNWYPDPEGVYKAIAKEFRPDILSDEVFSADDHVQIARGVNDIIQNGLTEKIKFALSQVLLHEQFDAIKASHDFEIQFADIWNGSEGCAWHCDAIEGGAFLLLVYLTDYDEWDDSFGGQLEYGKITPAFGDGYFIDYEARSGDIESYGMVRPENGTFVVVNNHNQFMTHRCFKMTNKEHKRITLTMGFDLKVKADFCQPSSVIWKDGARFSEE